MTAQCMVYRVNYIWIPELLHILRVNFKLQKFHIAPMHNSCYFIGKIILFCFTSSLTVVIA